MWQDLGHLDGAPIAADTPISNLLGGLRMNRIQNLSSKEVTATGSRCGQPSQREAEKQNWKGAGGRLARGGLQTFQPLLELGVYLKKIERHPLLHAWSFMQHHQPHLHPQILHSGRSLACQIQGSLPNGDFHKLLMGKAFLSSTSKN